METVMRMKLVDKRKRTRNPIRKDTKYITDRTRMVEQEYARMILCRTQKTTQLDEGSL